RLAVVVSWGFCGAVVPGPGAGGRLDLAAVEGSEDVGEVVDGRPESVAALGHVLGRAVAAGAGVTLGARVEESIRCPEGHAETLAGVGVEAGWGEPGRGLRVGGELVGEDDRGGERAV